MEKGARVLVRHDLYVNCNLSLEHINAKIRKSYKSLVNRGREDWLVELHEQASSTLFDEFRNLHHEVSGRITRSQETWDHQLHLVNRNNGFLITLRDRQDERMIGASLFQYTPWEAMYAVAVYDRSLFHKGLGHVVQMEAIRELKKKGVKWYYIGQRPYPGDESTPDDKELSIAYFKEGFMTDMFVSMDMELC